MMKKFWRKGLFALLALALFHETAWAGAVTVLSMNDIHSGLFPVEATVKRDGREVKEKVGGAAKMISLLERERAAAPGQTLSLSAGDFTDGALFYYFNGDPEILALNRMGWDVSAVGNHEFDHGMIGFRKMLGMLKFPLISSNLVFRDVSLNAMVRQTFTKTLADGTKVGVFALMTPELGFVSNITKEGEVRVEQDLAAVAKEQVRRLREEEGCSVVIALTHIGFENDKLLASQVTGVNAIVGGHSHTEVPELTLVKNPEGMEVPVTQTGAYGRYLGKLVLDVKDGVTQKEGTRWELIDLEQGVPLESEAAAELKLYDDKLQTELGKAVAVSKDPWDAGKAFVRSRESNVGSFMADAMRWKTGTDVAFVNGGSIRGDRVYPAGDVSFKMLYTIMPFVNYLNRLEMTGAQLKEFLENSASCMIVEGDGYDASTRGATGGFEQVSGLRVTFDRKAPPALIDNSGALVRPGSRVTKVELAKADGTYEPLDPAKTYSVTLYKWTADGGDKFYSVKGIKSVETYLNNVDVLVEYLKSFDGPFSLPPLGRMIFE